MFSNGSNGTWAYAYDGASRMTQAVLDYPGTSPASTQWDYAYDGAGNRTLAKQTTLPSTVTSNVLTSYDASGLPTSSSNTIGGETVTYTHDKIGELTIADSSVTGGANDWGYGYDAYGRMTCAKSAATTCASGATLQTSVYDALDRTTSTTLNSVSTSNAFRGMTDVLTRRVGTVTTAYAATAAGTPIAEKGSTTNPFLYLRDPHGDIVSSVSTAAANQTTRTFDPYGKPLTMTQVSGSQPVLGYQGDLTDPATSLVDMGIRYYQPTTGRFTSRDVLAGDVTSPMSLNRFAYGAMNPVTTWDPTGMTCRVIDGVREPCPMTSGDNDDDGGWVHNNPVTGAKTKSDSAGNVTSVRAGTRPVPSPEPACHAKSCAYVWDIPDYVNPFQSATSGSDTAEKGCGFLGMHCWDDVGAGLALGVARCAKYFFSCGEDADRAAFVPLILLGGLQRGSPWPWWVASVRRGLAAFHQS